MSKLIHAIIAAGITAFVAARAAGAAPAAVAAGTVPTPTATAPTAAEARTLVARAETELTEVTDELQRIGWVQSTFITDDTDWLYARTFSKATEIGVRLAKQSARYDHVKVDDVTRRKLYLLKQQLVLPAASRAGASEELGAINSRLKSDYSTAKVSYQGKTLALDDLESLLRTSRDPVETRTVWEDWRAASGPQMKADYARMVDLSNEGAREIGFRDTGEFWRSWYDMPPDAFALKVDALWEQLKPLYTSLHCYVRARLSQHYGPDVQPSTGAIRADLLGNMWGQKWNNIYDLVAPAQQPATYDLTASLVQHGYDAQKMAHVADDWYQSIGFAPEPQTFWERSQFTRPRDRDVVCHPSAWDVDSRDDLRIKACLTITADDFYTVHHELGHNMYQRAYAGQPFLFRDGANDGFHEAIGDFAGLNALTPGYLKELGLIDRIPGPESDIPYLLRMALDKIAFLPFAVVVDKWRWGVFAGTIKPQQYNDAWWALVQQYQGLRPPGPRPADAFDPGAKYHVADSTPYARYFLAAIYQFQFYRAACRMAGVEGPLNRCSIYRNREVGQKFEAMLKLGRSKPWPEVLAAFSGEHDIDASAIAEYFSPLATWLTEQNKGQSCSAQ